jgi:selenophosphate synthetase-related protein
MRALAETLRNARGLAAKADIRTVAEQLGLLPASAIPVGDDCAAIRDGDGYLLFAIEGFINEFVAADPWFAGWCGAMVNISDVAAMGGRPIAVVDAVWADGGERPRRSSPAFAPRRRRSPFRSPAATPICAPTAGSFRSPFSAAPRGS